MTATAAAPFDRPAAPFDLAEAGAGYRDLRFSRVAVAGGEAPIARAVAEEVPIALEFDGFGYAVLMATPSNLVDLVLGFSLTERLINRADQLVDVDVAETPAGIVARIVLAPEVAERTAERVRHRTSDSSCGLCGIENLEQALRPLPALAASSLPDAAAIFRAAAALADLQPLNRATGAVHAAAACTAAGEPWLVREDVGRHNAFDKLIGAMLRKRRGWDGGFALLSSRCSFELVEKAVLARCPLLATISAPTTLAIARAEEAGLALRVLVRNDALLVPTTR